MNSQISNNPFSAFEVKEAPEFESVEIVIGGAELSKHVRVSFDDEIGKVFTNKSKSYVSKVVNRVKTYLANA
ncbi:hypothetical protein HY837_06510 [archaeon]|nr:hypothetical protein [archaeon]